ncbi:MAG: TIGR01459 family HAD-type hydrolase [Paracoccaceae bacterium]
MIPSTLDDLVERFEAFLVDQFGVLLDGAGAYPGAPAALARLAATGKPLILLSNSGKRAVHNEARLVGLGFARESFLCVLSSGEAAWRALERRLGGDLARGAKVWLHGRDGDRSQIDGLDLRAVEDPGEAGLLLLAGSRGDVMGIEAYRDLLRPAVDRGVPMLCTNPDLEMLTPVGPRFGAGQIALEYAAMGGAVEWIGKPYPLIYAEAARLLPGVAADRVLCIGDSPAHDVAGGRGAGHATVLVQTGLHAGVPLADLRALCEAEGAVPDFVIPSFDFQE